MLMIGTKDEQKYLGRRAEYCPLCRQVRPTRRFSLQSVSHINYVPMGRATPLEIRETCEVCGLTHRINDDDRAPLHRSRRAPLDVLIAETNPDVFKTHAASLTLADRLKSRTADPAQGREAVAATILLAGVVLEGRRAGGKVDRLTAISLAGVLAGPLLVFAVGEGPSVELWAAISAGFFVLAAILSHFTDATRHFRSRLEPLLADSLAPFDPPLEDLEEILGGARETNPELARRLNPARLRELVSQSRAGTENSGAFV